MFIQRSSVATVLVECLQRLDVFADVGVVSFAQFMYSRLLPGFLADSTPYYVAVRCVYGVFGLSHTLFDRGVVVLCVLFFCSCSAGFS